MLHMLLRPATGSEINEPNFKAAFSPDYVNRYVIYQLYLSTDMSKESSTI